MLGSAHQHLAAKSEDRAPWGIEKHIYMLKIAVGSELRNESPVGRGVINRNFSRGGVPDDGEDG